MNKTGQTGQVTIFQFQSSLNNLVHFLFSHTNHFFSPKELKLIVTIELTVYMTIKKLNSKNMLIYIKHD